MIILVGGLKGGPGKSTIAQNLTVGFIQSGLDVLLVDADPQATSAKWVERRNSLIDSGENIPQVFCDQRTGNIRHDLLDRAKRYDVVVVDAGGWDSRAFRTALTVANLFYVPFQVSRADLETLPDLCTNIAEAKDYNPTLTSKAIISRAPNIPGGRELKRAKELLGDKDISDYLELSNVVIRELKVFRDALDEGRSVLEMPTNNAKACIQLLLQEIAGHELAA
ncbi:AAA family ATPase [Spartinivicinus ruber]|uniref:AAA family ATPase n=1 Tax=Spartinivicinus ruber TaxID=2683272 RepID=UPI0013D652E1|nr:AAA family ATPase [Spartinivicinus ruber]